MRRLAETFLVFLALGLTSFGGPVAHLGYFHAEFVTRRKWLSEADYADLVALCQAIPGPASSQVGIAIGYRRAGLSGAIAAFISAAKRSIASGWRASAFQTLLMSAGAMPRAVAMASTTALARGTMSSYSVSLAMDRSLEVEDERLSTYAGRR